MVSKGANTVFCLETVPTELVSKAVWTIQSHQVQIGKMGLRFRCLVHKTLHDRIRHLKGQGGGISPQ